MFDWVVEIIGGWVCSLLPLRVWLAITAVLAVVVLFVIAVVAVINASYPS